MPYKSHGDGSWHFYELQHHAQKDPCPKCLVGASEAVIEASSLIFHPNLCTIGSGTYIGHRSILKGYPLNASDRLPSIEIGKNCWIGENIYFHGAGHIKIGDGVGIGPNVQILTSFHDLSGHGPVIQNPLMFKPVTIKDGADIEAGVFICAGVTIGRGAVVRAASVVTHNVGDYEIVQGSPAKYFGVRVDKDAHFMMAAL